MAPSADGDHMNALADSADAWPARKLVVMGASAGGLDALCRVFDHTPSQSGAAFVVIQHLSPDHPTLMDTLLARHTQMPVRLVTEETPLAPDTVYLIPPGKHLGLHEHQLTLTPKPVQGIGLPIDDFLSVAAEHWGERVLAIILSGTGGDGSRGIVRVSEAGGHVLAQSTATSAFDGMPRTAVATGVVDEVLPPEQIGQWLRKHLQHWLATEGRGQDADPSGRTDGSTQDAEILRQTDRLATLVRQQTGMPMDQYKPDMLLRRVRRRMQLLGLNDLADYVAHMESATDESKLLRKEILIPVTHFFRDVDTFEALSRHALPDLLRSLRTDQPLRAWVAATATGEEAYSLAMTLQEACDDARKWPPIKVYATDIEQSYLDVAAAGCYPESIEREVSRERLDRFFTHRDGHYQVRPELRAMIVFARHDLINDPPFTQMHLVSCRNMLIYLRQSAQTQVLRRLQYGLKPGGVLMLGRSETPSAIQDNLQVIDSRARLFRPGSPLSTSALQQMTGSSRQPAMAPPHAIVPAVSHTHLLGALQQLAERYAPPGLIIDEHGQLLQVIGDMSALLQMRAGAPSLLVHDLLPPELEPVVRQLLNHLAQQEGLVRSPKLRLSELNHRWPHETLTVSATRVQTGLPPHLPSPTLLLFEPDGVRVSTSEPAVELALGDAARDRVAQLERELALTRNNLQATIEELQTANEELQSNNEELMSSNEELQSTNEELQSVNEELYTINSEYQSKLELLQHLHADLDGMGRAVGIPSLFVDEDLRLQRLTREASALFNLREADMGRSIEDFSHRLDFPELYHELRRAMRTGQTVEREVRSDQGRWYLARLIPYGPSGHEPGSTKRAVVSFVDLSPVRNASRLQAILDALPLSLAVLDFTGRIASVNQPWRQFAADNGDPAQAHTGPGHNYLQVIRNGHSGRPETDGDSRAIEAGLTGVLRGDRQHFQQVYPCHAPHERRWFAMHATALKGDGGGAVIAHYNVTRWVCPQQEPSHEHHQSAT